MMLKMMNVHVVRIKRWWHALACVWMLGGAVLALGQQPSEDPLRPTGGQWPPVIGAWFWGNGTLDPDGFKPFLDNIAAHTPYTLLSTSVRVPRGEITDPIVIEQVAQAVRYAKSLGLEIAYEFDIRLARRAFQARYPDELQEELVLKAVDVPASGTASVSFEGHDLVDHMNGGTTPYLCLTSRVVRVYAFERGTNGIDPATVRDVTDLGVRAVADGPRKLTVTIPSTVGRTACVIASHTYLTPDVFAPHFLSFQREVVRLYAGIPLAGVMKDEWGFPPDHTGNPGHDHYWYSAAMARAYRDASSGRDLVRDALLMWAGEKGCEREREAAINRYGLLCRKRNADIEDAYYRLGKQVYGNASFVVTHATWTPYPGPQEFRKNGLDWWDATRDIGQSDETTPYPCRTSLAKRWGFPLWYNQYYSPQTNDYTRELWAGALSGGRLNVHPLYPRPDLRDGETYRALLRHGLMAGTSRLRMLDAITRAPLDCPVAVIFGHACAMNWAGPSYNSVGLEIASRLCAEGYPADLFPTSLAGKPALRLDHDGYLCLGPQRYRIAVLHQPEFGSDKELAFFERVARGKTALFVVGDWTRDAFARPLDAASRLERHARFFPDDAACLEAVQKHLAQAGVTRVTPWKQTSPTQAVPPTDGHSALTDGTYVRIAAANNPEGDPIRETFTWQGHTVTVDATGLFAIRFAQDGSIAALAAGGLKSIKTDGLDITLPDRLDLAYTRSRNGKTDGVLQGLTGPIPSVLQTLTPTWHRLAIPPRLP